MDRPFALTDRAEIKEEPDTGRTLHESSSPYFEGSNYNNNYKGRTRPSILPSVPSSCTGFSGWSRTLPPRRTQQKGKRVLGPVQSQLLWGVWVGSTTLSNFRVSRIVLRVRNYGTYKDQRESSREAFLHILFPWGSRHNMIPHPSIHTHTPPPLFSPATSPVPGPVSDVGWSYPCGLSILDSGPGGALSTVAPETGVEGPSSRRVLVFRFVSPRLSFFGVTEG